MGVIKLQFLLRFRRSTTREWLYDCGLFAIANLVEFCFNPDNSFQIKTSFKSECMRNHLIECLENGKFTKFPQISSQTSDTAVLKHRF